MASRLQHLPWSLHDAQLGSHNTSKPRSLPSRRPVNIIQLLALVSAIDLTSLIMARSSGGSAAAASKVGPVFHPYDMAHD